MKKTFLSFLIVCLIALFAFSCAESSSGGGGGVSVENPTEVTTTDVAHSFTGTGTAPTTETAATDTASDVNEDIANIGTEISQDMSSESAMDGPALGGLRAAKTVEPTTIALGYPDFNGGSVTYSGTYNMSEFSEDAMTETETSISINTSMTMDATQSVTYTDVEPAGKDYSLNGQQNINMASRMDIDLTVNFDSNYDITGISGSGISATMAFSDRACYAVDGDTVSCYIVVSTNLTATMSITAETFQGLMEGTTDIETLDLSPTYTATCTVTVYDTDGNETLNVDLSEDDDFLYGYIGGNIEGLSDMSDFFM